VRVVRAEGPQVRLPEPGEERVFSTELCACSDAYTVMGGSAPWSPFAFWEKRLVRSRAQRSAVSVDIDAESCTAPVNDSGRPIICRIHSMTTCSSSVAAGEVCQLIPCTPSPAASRSPSTEARLVLDGK
jgi:hypothetical protein